MGWLTLCCWMLPGTLGWKSHEQGGMQLVLPGHGPGQCHKPCSVFAVFIYSMPGYKCSIKERMLYSSCKSRLLDTVEQEFCLEIAKKVRVSSLRGDGAEHCQGAVLQPWSSPCDGLGGQLGAPKVAVRPQGSC